METSDKNARPSGSIGRVGVLVHFYSQATSSEVVLVSDENIRFISVSYTTVHSGVARTLYIIV